MTKNTAKTMIIVLMLVAVGLYFISGTYARYTGTASGTGTINVAKWAVKVNDKDATASDATFDLTFTEVENNNVVDGYIAPASKLYADFVIDPAGSQVAVDYSFVLGNITASTGDVPTTIKVSKVVPVTSTGEGSALTASEGTYKGTINLAIQTAALTTDNAVKIRVYIEWENSESSNSTDTTVGTTAPILTMTVNATVQQHID